MKLTIDFHPMWILLTGLILVRSEDISLIPNNPVVAAFVNGSYFVSCRAPQATKIIWTKGGDEITQTSGKVHIEMKSDTDSLDLVFESIKKKDKGDYVCKAYFDHGVDKHEVEKRFNLTVFKPISFGDTPIVQNATEGDNMLIRCDVGGDPTLRMSWIFRGKLVRASHRYEVTPTGLFIKDVTLDDGGDYSCRAMQTNSMVTDFKEIPIKLIIQHKPRWSNEHVEGAYGFIGGKVNLSCSALAEPGADFTWIKDNRTIQTGDDVEIFNATRHLSILQITIRDASAFGDYECRATNALGTMARVQVLDQIDPPPPPTFRIKTAQAEAIILNIDESTDLMSDRRQDGNKVSLDVTGYVVQYKLVDDDWDAAEEAAFDRTPSKSYTVSGLKHEAEYELRVAARTAAGVGEFSASQVEKTKKWVTTAAPVLDGGSASASSCTWFQRCIFGFLAVALAAASL